MNSEETKMVSLRVPLSLLTKIKTKTDNVSAYFVQLAAKDVEGTEGYLKRKRDELQEQIDKREALIISMKRDMDQLSVRFDQAVTSEAETESARAQLVEHARQRPGASAFRLADAFAGPAIIEIVTKAGFKTTEEAAAWCLQQKGKL